MPYRELSISSGPKVKGVDFRKLSRRGDIITAKTASTEPLLHLWEEVLVCGAKPGEQGGCWMRLNAHSYKKRQEGLCPFSQTVLTVLIQHRNTRKSLTSNFLHNHMQS